MANLEYSEISSSCLQIGSWEICLAAKTIIPGTGHTGSRSNIAGGRPCWSLRVFVKIRAHLAYPTRGWIFNLESATQNVDRKIYKGGKILVSFLERFHRGCSLDREQDLICNKIGDRDWPECHLTRNMSRFTLFGWSRWCQCIFFVHTFHIWTNYWFWRFIDLRRLWSKQSWVDTEAGSNEGFSLREVPILEHFPEGGSIPFIEFSSHILILPVNSLSIKGAFVKGVMILTGTDVRYKGHL